MAGRTPDGRRVAALLPSGGYAERIARPEAILVPVPDEVSDEQAAGLLLQGLTARSLLRISARLEQGRVGRRPGARPAAPARSRCSSPSGWAPAG